MTASPALQPPPGQRETFETNPGVGTELGEFLSLRDPSALDAAVVGAKGAALAMAASAGYPVAVGGVFTVSVVGQLKRLLIDGTLPSAPETAGELVELIDITWEVTTGSGTRPVVVRSSSPHEDGEFRSMAGHFTSVLNVITRSEYVDAITEVIRSAEGGQMAVLVQQQIDAAAAGIMFGVDPRAPDSGDILVSAVHGTPDELVSGLVDGTSYVLTRRGRIRNRKGRMQLLSRRQTRRLAGLNRLLQRRFQAPQDVEWAFDHDGRLWLLQTRPITAVSRHPETHGPVLGAGPIAETFPAPLSRLEADLWVPPLAAGISAALGVTGAASRRAIDDSLVVSTLGGGWVVADLELLGVVKPHRLFLLRLLDLRPVLRSLSSAWRVGRLRSMLPDLGRLTIRDADRALGKVPHPSELTDRELLAALLASRSSLEALHSQEVCASLLGGDPSASRGTAVGAAYRAIADARRRGLGDGEIIAEEPSVLALFPPSITAVRRQLPKTLLHNPENVAGADDGAGILREALRLRVRWTHELMARCARELGHRMAEQGRIVAADQVSNLTLEETVSLVLDRHHPPVHPAPMCPASPIPTTFRLDAHGNPVACQVSGEQGQGVGVGGGRASGLVWQMVDGQPPPGRVLVAAHLEPGLALHLPHAAGLITETGNVLSHLAIVARELGVPTVVQAPDACEHYASGTRVIVDGDIGTVVVDHQAEEML